MYHVKGAGLSKGLSPGDRGVGAFGAGSLP